MFGSRLVLNRSAHPHPGHHHYDLSNKPANPTTILEKNADFMTVLVVY